MNDTSRVTIIRPTLAYALDSTLLPVMVCAVPIALFVPRGSSKILLLLTILLACLVASFLVRFRLLKIRVVVTNNDVIFHDSDKHLRFKIADIRGYEVEKFKAETYLIIKQKFENSEKICISGIDVKRLLREINRREE